MPQHRRAKPTPRKVPKPRRAAAKAAGGKALPAAPTYQTLGKQVTTVHTKTPSGEVTWSISPYHGVAKPWQTGAGIDWGKVARGEIPLPAGYEDRTPVNPMQAAQDRVTAANQASYSKYVKDYYKAAGTKVKGKSKPLPLPKRGLGGTPKKHSAPKRAATLQQRIRKLRKKLSHR